MTIYDVLIVGCGNIAGGFDEGKPIKSDPFTHAGAYRLHDGFRIVACIDPDSVRREKFMAIWKIPNGFKSIAEFRRSGIPIAVASICSPTKSHYQNLEEILPLNPRLIFCEKPLTGESNKSHAVFKKCADLNISVMVNFTRRWDPFTIRLMADLAGGEWGKVRSINALYSGGLKNNGSHFLDLFQMIFGQLNVISVGRPLLDGRACDPSFPIFFESNSGIPIMLNVGDSLNYSLFEMQIICDHGIISMEKGGLSWRIRYPKVSSNFRGYKALEDEKMVMGTLGDAMYAAISEIYMHLNRGEKLSSSFANALAVEEMCEYISNLVKSPHP